MPYITNATANTGSFIPTTNVWDVSRIAEVDVKSPEFKELLVRLYQNINNIALVLNTKETGYCLTQEFNTSKMLFNNTSTLNSQQDLRSIYRLVVDTGALVAGVKSVPHNLPFDASWKMLFISGSATDTVHLLYYPLPFSHTIAAGDIQVAVDGTNVNIDNQSGVVFDFSYVSLEYVKY